MHTKKLAWLPMAAIAGLLCVGTRALAHGDGAHHASGPVRIEQTDWGIAGQALAARRTITIRMRDTMRFTPDHIEVKQGETVTLVIRNEGQVLHEFVLGTGAALETHAALMLRFPNMQHEEPYMAHVPPGGTARLVWTFNRAGNFDFACLLPGHFQAGMTGKVTVLP